MNPRVGLIGYGGWTRMAYVPALRRDGRARIISAAAPSEATQQRIRAELGDEVAVFASAADLESLSGQDFLDIYSVNVVGAYQMVRAVTPHLKAGGQGSIVNVSSISAITGGGSSIAYAASKAALNAMTLSLARALAPTVRVNSVCPGPIPTRWWGDGLGEDGARELFRKFAEQVPLQEAPTVESVAETVVWLLEAGGHITGETIMIDSGMHLIGFKP